MFMKFSECANAAGLFEDFVKYKSVDSYIEAVLNVNGKEKFGSKNCPNFVPLDLSVKISNDTHFVFIKDGKVDEDAKEMLDIFKKLFSPQDRKFMSDFIIIEGDGFENEISFSWDKRRHYPVG